MEEKVEKKEKRKFTDSIIYLFLISLIIIEAGSVLSMGVIYLLNVDIKEYEIYYSFVGPFILLFLVIALIKRNKYMLKKMKFNVLHVLLGLVTGALLNFLCVYIATLNKDLIFTGGTYTITFIIISFILVFIQSSTEELLCRLFLYQRLKETYKKPWVVILASSLFFGLLHLANPGITVVSFIFIVLFGAFAGLIIYYFDSIWLACGVHAAWNFTQNIIFGLPNSGQAATKSIYSIVNSNDSFFYSTTFGIEGSIFAAIIFTVSCLALYLLFRNKKRISD